MADRAARDESSRVRAFTLHCRGDVRLYCGDRDCTPRPKKGRALLAVLAAEQRPLTRIKIIDLLWSDRQEEQARASLRTLLADLKEHFGEQFNELLIVDRERLALNRAIRTDLTDPALVHPAGELFEGLDHIDPELDEWLRLERQKWAKQVSAPAVRAFATVRPHGLPQWAHAALLIFALIGGALLNFRPWTDSEQPVVAVLKFRDLTGKNALLADGLAEELRIQLAQHPRLQVIGRESSEAPSVLKNPSQAHDKLGASFLVEGSILNRDGSAQLGIRLTDAVTGRQFWSQLLPAEGAMIRAGSAGIAARLAGNINETVGQGIGDAYAADASAYEHVFAARRAIRERDIPDILEARSALKNDLALHPHFAPALAALAELCIAASDHPFSRGPIPLTVARKEAAAYARRAIVAAPDFGPGYTALGVAYVETPAAMRPFKRAVELNPGSYEAHYRLARALELAGDYQASLIHERAAGALEPLDVTAHYQLVRMLRLTGHRSEIPDLVSRFVRRTDDRFKKLYFIAGSAIETGDLSTSYLAAREMLRLQPQHVQARRLMMWLSIYYGDRRAAAAFASSPDSVTAIMLRDDASVLVRKAAALGSDFWSLDWETLDASNYLVRRGRSDLVASIYVQTRAASAGKEPSLSAIDSAVIVALRHAGNTAEADKLVRESEQYLDRSGQSPAVAAVARADILLLRGKIDEALNQLVRAQREDWWNLQSSVVPWEDRAVFETVRNYPRFRAIVRTYYGNIAREKRELAAGLKRFGNGPIDPERLI